MKPLIARVGDHFVLWVQDGRGWLLDLYEPHARWEDLPGTAHQVTHSGRGRLLRPSEVNHVTELYGRPKELMS